MRRLWLCAYALCRHWHSLAASHSPCCNCIFTFNVTFLFSIRIHLQSRSSFSSIFFYPVVTGSSWNSTAIAIDPRFDSNKSFRTQIACVCDIIASPWIRRENSSNATNVAAMQTIRTKLPLTPNALATQKSWKSPTISDSISNVLMQKYFLQ